MPQQPMGGTVVRISYEATNAQNVVTTGSVELPVLVYHRNFTADAGYHYVLLFHRDSLGQPTQRPFRTAMAAASGGKYVYTFTKVPAGRYEITAGSDINGNNFIGDLPDAKGDYPILGRKSEIVVGGSHVRGLDFTTGYYLY